MWYRTAAWRMGDTKLGAMSQQAMPAGTGRQQGFEPVRNVASDGPRLYLPVGFA